MKELLVVPLIMIMLILAPSIAFGSANSDAKTAITKAIDKAVKGQWKGICFDGISINANQSLKIVYSKDVSRCKVVIPPIPVNKIPTPRITLSKGVANVSDVISVNGNQSFDEDGVITKYSWTGANFTDPNSISTNFTFPNVSSVSVGLTVTDNNNASVPTTALVTKWIPPIVCGLGTHPEGGKCVPNPPPPPSDTVPPLDTGASFRLGAVGDVDCNTAQSKEFQQLKTLEVQYAVIPGDFDYNDGQCVLSSLASYQYTSGNTALAVGNHDQCSDVIKFSKQPKCWYHVASGKVEFFVMDTEDAFGSGSAQYTDIKNWLAQSTAQYKIVVIHEPFVTAKSTHPNNGQFSVYHPIFKAAGVILVLEAHNHNWQHFNIDKIDYDVVGTGTHDQGSALYDITSSNDGQGHNLIKGFDNKNGVTIIDLNIGNSTKITKSWFVNLADNKVLNSFVN